MISPYVRRLRLGHELEALRLARKLTHAQLGKLAGVDRSRISKLENARNRPEIDVVIAILDAMDVTGKQWSELVTMAQEGAERGWWESTAVAMGERQALTANLEAGATLIREYQLAWVPGLLQTADFAREIAERTPADNPESFIRARDVRQRMLRRDDGPAYEVIVDELVIARPTASPDVFAGQLRALANPENDRITVRVLPIKAELDLSAVPKNAFSLYEYADPADPHIAAVDTVTTDVTLTDEGQVTPYEKLFERLRAAALPPQDSATLLEQAADDMKGMS